jgi:SAM-dependent methyltransferase
MTASSCRSCSAPLEHTFCDLGMSPLSNSYLTADQLQQKEPFYPLHAYVCGNCYLVQLDEFESPQQLFSEYAYFSSYSDSWLQHSRDYAQMISARLGLDETSQVVEIASNDGYLLQYFVEQKIPVVGIEPAANVAAVAEEKGIPTLVKFFGTQTANEMLDENLQADLVLGNNVLAHVPDLNDFVAGMKVILKPSGTITLEFPHLLKLIQGNQFDTIYHEHFSYFSLLAVERVFANHGMQIFDVDQLPTHGGSLRIYVRHADHQDAPVTDAVQSLRDLESESGLADLATYAAFADQVESTKRSLLKFLTDAKQDGLSVAAYGAPAKGNTLLNYCGIRRDFIDFTVDRSPAKQGHYLPGTHIPVFAPDKIRESKPDFLVILPWNIKDEIIGKMSHIREWGGKFVIPIPSVEILS